MAALNRIRFFCLEIPFVKGTIPGSDEMIATLINFQSIDLTKPDDGVERVDGCEEMIFDEESDIQERGRTLGFKLFWLWWNGKTHLSEPFIPATQSKSIESSAVGLYDTHHHESDSFDVGENS
ncbi:hypothetical protein BY996DRAFT_6463003 [Phakopsora pachyrhizi]|nr:hypothetical protein BY996DRAFT_6463003 [Phakopsora pachyrhizi]